MNALQVWEAVGALGILSNRGSSSSSGGNGSGSDCTGTEAATAEADPTSAASSFTEEPARAVGIVAAVEDILVPGDATATAPSEAPVDADMTEVAAAVEILKTAPAAVNGAIDKAAPRARKKTAHSRKKAALGAVARTSISAVEAHAGATAAPNWSPKAEELPPAAQAPDSSNPNTHGGKAKNKRKIRLDFDNDDDDYDSEAVRRL